MKPVPISVILPFFNAERTLERAVQSILKQTFRDFELLLVDNNSTDQSADIAWKLAQSDDRIKLLHEPQQGVVFAMNCGMDAARGSYLARMDADDVSLPGRLEKQYRFLQNYPDVGLVGCNVRHVSSLPSKGLQRFVDWVNAFHSEEEIWLNRFVEIPIIQPSVLFRGELLRQHGAYRQGDFPEDYELFLRWLAGGVCFAQLPDVLLEWHDSETRLTRTDERYSTEAFYKTKAHYFAQWFLQNQARKALWIWGAGRKSRQRVRFLEEEGLQVAGYYDLKAHKTTEKRCLAFHDVPQPGTQFILSMVGRYGAREKISSFLDSRQYRAGHDYLMMA